MDSVSKILKSVPALDAKWMKTLPTGNNAEVVIFQNATVADFEACCEAFAKADYTEYSKTSFCGKAFENGGNEAYYKSYFDVSFDDNFEPENYFATYVSDACSIDIGFHEFDNFLSVAISPRDELTLPNREAPAAREKLPITITQLGLGDLHSEAEMCYVIRLADGSFIVYDTGLSYDERGSAGDEIYRVLCKQAADPENIVITAFVLTHPHGDHIWGFLKFADSYASYANIKVKQVIYNYPGIECMSPEIRPHEHQHRLSVEAAIRKFGPDVEVVKPRSGNVLYYPGVKFNVVYTQEDYLSLADDFAGSAMGNVMSLVMQMVTDDGTKVFFGADHWADQAKGQLKYRYGSFLESYICTLFHHGQGGGAEDNAALKGPDGWKNSIYAQAIRPKIVLWPSRWATLTTIGDRDQRKISRNKYFTMTGPDMDTLLEGNVLHSEADANPYGVRGWFSAEAGIQIVTILGKDDISIVKYETRDVYYHS